MIPSQFWKTALEKFFSKQKTVFLLKTFQCEVRRTIEEFALKDLFQPLFLNVPFEAGAFGLPPI